MSCGGVGMVWLHAQALRGAGLGGLAVGRGRCCGEGTVLLWCPPSSCPVPQPCLGLQAPLEMFPGCRV